MRGSNLTYCKQGKGMHHRPQATHKVYIVLLSQMQGWCELCEEWLDMLIEGIVECLHVDAQIPRAMSAQVCNTVRK